MTLTYLSVVLSSHNSNWFMLWFSFSSYMFFYETKFIVLHLPKEVKEKHYSLGEKIVHFWLHDSISLSFFLAQTPVLEWRKFFKYTKMAQIPHLKWRTISKCSHYVMVLRESVINYAKKINHRNYESAFSS